MVLISLPVFQVGSRSLVELQFRLRKDSSPVADATFHHPSQEIVSLLFSPFPQLLARAASCLGRHRFITVFCRLLGRRRRPGCTVFAARMALLVIACCCHCFIAHLTRASSFLLSLQIQNLLQPSFPLVDRLLCRVSVRRRYGVRPTHGPVLCRPRQDRRKRAWLDGRKEGRVRRWFIQAVQDGKGPKRRRGFLLTLSMRNRQLERLAGKVISGDVQATTLVRSILLKGGVRQFLDGTEIDEGRKDGLRRRFETGHRVD